MLSCGDCGELVERVSHEAFACAFILVVFSYRRNFYRTGQDLNNCSTCQNTACIIYRYQCKQ